MSDGIELNKKEYIALCNVIDNIEDREMIHYEESGYPKDHVYLDIVTLSLVLKKYKYKENK